MSPGGLDSNINPHFGRCETVTFVTIENNEIIGTEIIKPQGAHSCASLPTLFAQNGAEICIVGGIGGRPYMILQEYGIKTFKIDSDLINKPIREIVTNFIDKGLSELKNGTCQHNDH